MGYVEELRKIVGNRPVILPGSTVLLINDKNEILLQQRLEPKDVWGLPGGLMELGESVEDTAKRELFEETTLVANELILLNVYSGPNYYTRLKNGDEYYSVTTAFICTDWEGTPVNNPSEGKELVFFKLDQLPDKIVGSHHVMIEAYMKRKNS
ncbi:MAG: NUDIX hydrolase [Bacillaceae bacterium]